MDERLGSISKVMLGMLLPRAIVLTGGVDREADCAEVADEVTLEINFVAEAGVFVRVGTDSQAADSHWGSDDRTTGPGARGASSQIRISAALDVTVDDAPVRAGVRRVLAVCAIGSVGAISSVCSVGAL